MSRADEEKRTAGADPRKMGPPAGGPPPGAPQGFDPSKFDPKKFDPKKGPPKFDPKDFDPEKMDPEEFKRRMEAGELPDFPKPKGIMKLLMPKMDFKDEGPSLTGMEQDNPGYRPLVRPDTSKQKDGRRGGPGGGPGGGRRGPGAMRGEKPKDFKGSMKHLIQYLMDFKWLILLVSICSVCSTVLATVNPRILAKVTDEISRGVAAVTAGGTNGVDFGYVSRVMLILLGLYIISALFSYAQGFALANVSNKISYNLRKAIIEKINRLPVNFFHTLSNGEVMSRITNDVDTVSHSMNQCLTQIITSVVTLVGVLVMMLSISWKLTLIAIAMLPFSGLCTAIMVGISQKHFRARQKLLGTVNGYVEEMYSGQQILKAFCAEDRARMEFDYENERLYNAFWKAEFLTGMMRPIMNFIGNAG